MERRDTSQWEFSFLADNQVVRSPEFGIAPGHDRVRYPIRLLRYWFGYQLLREEAERIGRPLDVLEVGVDVGQMLAFTRSGPSTIAVSDCAKLAVFVETAEFAVF